jgi:hypothetical protein
MNPADLKAWADALGVSPAAVVLGYFIWRLVWRAHAEIVVELRALRIAIYHTSPLNKPPPDDSWDKP